VVAVEYTLLVVFPMLLVDSDDKGTGYAADSLAIRRSLSFAVAVEYALLVAFLILRVDSDDNGTGYTAGSLAVTHISGGP
jgi:formate hydrogenlyase subunit 4